MREFSNKGISSTWIIIGVVIIVAVVGGSYFLYQTSLSSEAEFKVSNLVINPSKTEQGEDVRLMVDVTNTGGKMGEKTLEFHIDGITKRVRTHVPPGETETVPTLVTIEKEGKYNVRVEGLTDSFEVLTKKELAKPKMVVDGLEFTTTYRTSRGGFEEKFAYDLRNLGIEGYYEYRTEGDHTYYLTELKVINHKGSGVDPGIYDVHIVTERGDRVPKAFSEDLLGEAAVETSLDTYKRFDDDAFIPPEGRKGYFAFLVHKKVVPVKLVFRCKFLKDAKVEIAP